MRADLPQDDGDARGHWDESSGSKAILLPKGQVVWVLEWMVDLTTSLGATVSYESAPLEALSLAVMKQQDERGEP